MGPPPSIEVAQTGGRRGSGGAGRWGVGAGEWGVGSGEGRPAEAACMLSKGPHNAPQSREAASSHSSNPRVQAQASITSSRSLSLESHLAGLHTECPISLIPTTLSLLLNWHPRGEGFSIWSCSVVAFWLACGCEFELLTNHTLTVRWVHDNFYSSLGTAA